MAEELDDGEFWLPSEFLTDDDLLMDFKTDHFQTKRSDSFSTGFGINSDLSSPVESIMGSTETESDEDDFLTGLTRKLAHSTFQDSNLPTDYTSKGIKLSGSPQSTLCGCKPASSQSSPNSASRVSTPPDEKDVAGWDLLYAAAGEVARIRMIDETTPFQSAKLFPPPLNSNSNPNPNPIAVPVPKNTNNQTQTQAQISYLQFQATRFQRMKQQQQMMRDGVWRHGETEYKFQNRNITAEPVRTQGLSMAAWPTLKQSQHQHQQQQQQQPGSGMRAVFLGENGAKKERTGTGVFLPRRVGPDPTQIRKKPGCSTVLLPDRVVHALNLNLDTMDSQSHLRGNRNFTQEYDVIMAQQRRSITPQPVMNQELRLPQEWTY